MALLLISIHVTSYIKGDWSTTSEALLEQTQIQDSNKEQLHRADNIQKGPSMRSLEAEKL